MYVYLEERMCPNCEGYHDSIEYEFGGVPVLHCPAMPVRPEWTKVKEPRGYYGVLEEEFIPE